MSPLFIRIRSGQTLLEVMIALFVLTVGFLGILSLLSQSIFLSKTVSNETIATYLASEGIELAKSRIDHDIYQSLSGYGGWTRGGYDPTFPVSGNYELDYTTCEGVPQGLSCGQAPTYSGATLEFDPTANLYSYTSNSNSIATPFNREIKVVAQGTDELIVDSIVSWNTGPLTSQNVDLEDVFYNWPP